jgi:hypothetical protein
MKEIRNLERKEVDQKGERGVEKIFNRLRVEAHFITR